MRFRVLLCIIVYLACCVVSYGGMFADMWENGLYATPIRSWLDYSGMSLLLSAGGPFSLLLSYCITDGFEHGFKFW